MARSLAPYARRLAAVPPTLLLVALATFALARLAPGGPFVAERGIDPATLAALDRLYGLDRPWPEQFARWLWAALHFDFGPSLTWRDSSVSSLIAAAWPTSFELGAAALALAFLVGAPLGAWAALRRGSSGDAVAMGAAGMLQATPSFALAPLVQLSLGLWLRALPVGGWNGGDLRHLALPALVLAAPQVAAVARLARAATAEALDTPARRGLTAIGAGRAVSAWRAARAAALPLLSYLGPAATMTLTGSVVVETAFDLPGLGRLFAEGALGRDYPLATATALLAAAVALCANLFVDACYALADPRIRRG